MIEIPRRGDRIRLLSMFDDPDPIPTGTIGIITGLSNHGHGKDAWLQIDVDWENGRTLMLVVPPDCFEIVDKTPPKCG